MIDRRSLSQKRRVEKFIDQSGKCWDCSCKLMPGMYHADHRQALEHGGDNADDNIRLICLGCHKAKTRADHQARAKGDRIAVGGRQRRSRPMDGSRDSGLKKHMDGSVSRRA